MTQLALVDVEVGQADLAPDGSHQHHGLYAVWTETRHWLHPRSEEQHGARPIVQTHFQTSLIKGVGYERSPAILYQPVMRQLLKRHPDSRRSAVARIEVEIVCPKPNILTLSYFVTGKMSEIHFPPTMESVRCDELWRHTCFEAFIGSSSSDEYYEFNFAPSTQWAAYRFSSYRSGMKVADEISAPQIEVRLDQGSYVLQASLVLDGMSSLPPKAAWRIGLSAVIEETDGLKSYWALAHPPGKPDFHHKDCFVHTLPPLEQP